VDRLRNLRAVGEVAADYHVVAEVGSAVGRLTRLGLGVDVARRLTVNGCWGASWS
jgi:hypothetical protein